jgi:hypothetical protein
VSSDGQRFLLLKDVDPAAASGSQAPDRFVVVLNWLEELKARAPTR